MTQADISREMGVTRQTVNKTFIAVDSRVSRALLEAAQVNRVEISRVNPEKGFLLGRSPSSGMDTLVTFSERNGIQVWYKGEGGCSECSWRTNCKQKLLIEAEDRGIPLPEEAEEMEPSQLADILFDTIMER
ncbi:MAG: hypothetical protein JSV76_07640 [Candidatus Bathyarchaeota archaeon]|nr:MAG: hypothetical protein JSV76_07640 [Candidatus Bathyarchaeota archaeon]